MSSGKYRILIVDDDPVAQAILKDTFAEKDFDVHVAGDWTSMTEILFTQLPEAILLDVKLPGVDGDQIAETLSETVNQPPKVVLHSSLLISELTAMGNRVGAFAVLPKGADSVRIVETIVEAAKAFRRERGMTSVPQKRPDSYKPLSEDPKPAPRIRRRHPTDPPEDGATSEEVMVAGAGGRSDRIRGRSVLLASGARSRRDMAQSALVSGGLVVRTATSWSEVLEELGRNRVALILLDASLPGISGLQLGKALVAMQVDPPRILLWTRQDHSSADGLAREVKAAAVINHSMGGDSLLRIVSRSLGDPQTRPPDR